MERPAEERLRSWVWEPEDEGRKNAAWAASTNTTRRDTLARLAAEAHAAEEARRAAAPAPKRSYNPFSYFFGRSPSVAPNSSATTHPTAIGVPLPANAAAPPGSLAAVRAEGLALEKQRAEEQAKRNTVEQVKKSWNNKGKAPEPKLESRSWWNPTSLFLRNKPKAPEFVNATPANKRRLQLGSRTLRRLGTNATAVRNILASNHPVIIDSRLRGNVINDIVPKKSTGPTTLDLTDYVNVMLDTENKYTEEEKIERFKHIFLLIEIFEGRRTIQETTGRNVFSDPKRSIMNFFENLPHSYYSTFFAPFWSSNTQTNRGRKATQILQNGLVVLLSVTGATLATVLSVPLLAMLTYDATRNSKPILIQSVADIVQILRAFLKAGQEANPDAHDAAKILVEEGPGALALTRAQKEKKDRMEQLTAAITAEVENRYPEIVEQGAPQGKLNAALSHLELRANLRNDTDAKIITDALAVAAAAKDDAKDERLSVAADAAARAAAEQVAAAGSAAEIAKEKEERDERIKNMGETLKPIPGFPDLDRALGKLAVAMSDLGMDPTVIFTNLNMLRVPLAGAWRMGPADEPIKKMLVLYCVKRVNSIMIDENGPTPEDINTEIEQAVIAVIQAVNAAAVAYPAPAVAQAAAKLGAATAVTEDKSTRVNDAMAAAARAAQDAAAAGAARDPAQVLIKKAINDAINPEAAEAERLFDAAQAARAAAEAAVAESDRLQAELQAAVAKRPAKQGGRRAYTKGRIHTKRRRTMRR